MDNNNLKPNPSNSYSMNGFITMSKDLVALLRDLSLVIIFILLMLFPDNLNNLFTRAGFEEGSILGMKWKKGIVKSDISLKEALAQVGVFKTKIDSMNLVITKIQKKVTDPILKKELSNIEKKNKELSIATTRTQESARKTISANALLIKNAQETINENKNWGVVYGGDATISRAKYEAYQMAKKYDLPNTKIFFRQGVYRSVSIVSTRDEAVEVLSRAKQRQADAYIVPISSWCPNTNDKDGYLECTIQ